MFTKTVTVVTLYLLGMVLPSEAQAKTSASDWPTCTDGLKCIKTTYPQQRYPRLMADYHHQVKIAFPDENGGRIWVKGVSQSKDSLRLIAGREARIRENKKKDDNHENKAEVFEMVLDWDKNFDPLAEKCYRGFWQVTSRIFRFLPWVDDKFTPLGTSKIDEFVIPGDAT